MYLLKLAMRPWKASPFNQIFTSASLGTLLVLMAFLMWIESSFNPMIERLKHEQIVTAYLSPEISQIDEGKVLDSLKVNLGASALKDITVGFVNTEDFLSVVKEHYPKLGQELLNLGTQMNTVVPRFISLSGVFSEEIINKIQRIQGIESVESTKQRYQHIVDSFSTIQWITRVLMFGLMAVIFSVLLHQSRIQAYQFSQTASLLSLFGAGGFLTRVPLMISGLLTGLIGGLFAAVIWFQFGSWFSEQIIHFAPIFQRLSLPSSLFGVYVLLLGVMIGLAATIFSQFSKRDSANESY